MIELGGASNSFDARGDGMTRRAIRVTRGAPTSMSASDVLEFRRRIRDHAYDSVHAVDALARRILRSGDL